MAIEPIFFDSPASFRDWLRDHHGSATEVLVGYHKRHTATPSLTWAESVDEALCHGWIDGIRRRVDDDRYTIRFTPRKPRSIWSAVNIERVAELTREGRMQTAGLEAFARREDARSRIYAYEREAARLDPASEEQLKGNEQAWRFWESSPAGYRKTVSWWVVSAKQESTRQRRLAQLIDDSQHGRRIRELTPPGRRDAT